MNMLTYIADGLHRFKSKSDDLYKFISGWLETEENLAQASRRLESFSPRSDLKSAAISQGEVTAELLFRALTPFFVAGFCLDNRSGNWRFNQLFLFGQYFSAPASEAQLLDVDIPAMTDFQVLKTSGRYVLEKAQLGSLGKLWDSSAFIIRIDEVSSYLLICNRPRVFQLEHIENTVEFLRTQLASTGLLSQQPPNDV